MSAAHMVVYYSTATFEVTPNTVISHIGPILKTARAYNPQHGVTGALFFDHKYFMQVLEGDRENVSRTFTRVVPDRRHKDVVVVGAGPIKQRYFEDWSMGFFDGDRATVGIVNKYMNGRLFEPSRLTSADAFNFMLNLRDANKLTA